ncbi:dienelactone hydrolase [Massilia eurypsychrophila]|jgi:tetratricopeptide (TPR) repeat protein|uniref:Dienelactone hydrolase n=1 Tax=Massilia eurypsychrophila TaxID=1485217 RepID=A0A2G8T8D7_9BURK|nr:dienelactone hydrolase family protein [Massilia eurypsychrophila]PIL42326.1 dienelactone hydrolase [Massilia eurypsychrophila]
MRPIVLIAALFISTSAHADTYFQFDLNVGPYSVGLRVLQQYDHSRVYRTRFDVLTGRANSGERARPVQALVWYPARQGGKAVTYLDYVRTMATEEDLAITPQEIELRTSAWIEARSKRMDKEVLQRELRQVMWATRDAKPAAGKFPVVVYAPSRSAPAHENVEMCEFLASQGYVVISSADMGTRTRAMNTDREGLETGAADVRFLISTAHTLPQADTSRIGVVGFSWGGLINVAAAASDDRIGAVVSLDGSVRSYPKFIDGGAEALAYVTPARVAVPFLFIGARPKSVEQLASSPDMSLAYSFINSMKYSDVYVASMQPMIHRDFSSWSQRLSAPDPAQPYTRREALTAYEWTVRYVHQFLDAYLKENAPARAFLQKPASANGAPRNLMTIEQRPATGKAPRFEMLALELNQQGYQHALPLYRKMKQQDPKFEVSERGMDDWGGALVRAGRRNEAVEIFKLGVAIYPDSAALFDSLGDASESGGDKQRALEYYRRAFELEPDNATVARHVKRLEAAQ